MAALRRCTLQGDDYVHLGDLVELLRSSAPAARSKEARDVLDAVAAMLAGGGTPRGQAAGGLLLPPGMQANTSGTDLADAFANGQPVVSHELTRPATAAERQQL